MTPVLTKYDFVQRFIAGEFGNRTPVWRTLDEIDCDRGLFCLRSYEPGARTHYNLLLGTVYQLWTPKHYISQMIPPRVEGQCILQGEVSRCPELYLHCSTIRKPMKVAMEEASSHLTMSAANFALYHTLNTASYEHLMQLLDVYPDHVVEFSAYACEYGVEPGYNTLFWEVRRY